MNKTRNRDLFSAVSDPFSSIDREKDESGAPTSLSAVREHPARFLSKGGPVMPANRRQDAALQTVLSAGSSGQKNGRDGPQKNAGIEF